MTLSEHLAKLGENVKTGDAISDVVTAERMNAIMNCLKSLAAGENLVNGPGVLIKRNPNGAIITSTARGSGGPFSLDFPFQIIPGAGNSVRVRYGTLNDIAPSGINTDIVLATAGVRRVYLNAYIADAGSISTVVVVVGPGAQPSDTRSDAYLTLGMVTVEDIDGVLSISGIDQAVTHSLRFCASGRTATVQGTYNFWGV